MRVNDEERRDTIRTIILIGGLLIAASVTVTASVITKARGAELGIASVYSGLPSEGGRYASNGERINPRAMTAAHRTLPFGTLARIVNRNNGRSIAVRINDRGPFKRGRVVDLTPVANRALGCGGLCPVLVSVE